MIKPDRGTTPFKELKNGSVDVDVLQKMKELKRMIQFDDPACLLFTSVSPQTGFILIILEDFKIKMRFGSEHWSGVLQCEFFEPAGLLEEDYPVTTFFESKTLKFFFSSEIITFINLRALSWEVRCVQTVLKFSTVG